MTFRLMIKTHNITGLKYLCVTQRDNWEKYLGSGLYWKRHLKKHGNNISTELIYESDTYDDFIYVCLNTSISLNVVLSEDFANLIHENGDNKLNIFWIYASEEVKYNIIRKRNQSIKENHWSKSNNYDQICDKIRFANKQRWPSIPIEERREILSKLFEGSCTFFNNKNAEKYINWKDNISKTLKKYYANVPFEMLSVRNRKARNSLDSNKREHRKLKIQEVYKSGKHDDLFKRYSQERIGSGNPAAKKITVNGVTYGSVLEASRATGVASHKLYRLRRKNEEIEIDKSDRTI